MLSRIFACLSVVAILASVSDATIILEHGVNATIEIGEIGSSVGPRDTGVVYDSLLFEGNVQTPTTGPGGSISEDYVSTISTPSTLEIFQFVGGVETAGDVIFFQFADSTNTPVSVFGVALPTAGFTIPWTITLNDPTSIPVPDSGFVTLFADNGSNNASGNPTNAAWRFKDVAPAIGTTQGDVYRMTLTVVPEPAAVALLGFGVLAAIGLRRRV